MPRQPRPRPGRMRDTSANSCRTRREQPKRLPRTHRSLPPPWRWTRLQELARFRMRADVRQPLPPHRQAQPTQSRTLPASRPPHLSPLLQMRHKRPWWPRFRTRRQLQLQGVPPPFPRQRVCPRRFRLPSVLGRHLRPRQSKGVKQHHSPRRLTMRTSQWQQSGGSRNLWRLQSCRMNSRWMTTPP